MSGASYTAPADGWFFLAATANSQLGFILFYTSSNLMGAGSIARAETNSDGVRSFLPVRKGAIVTVEYAFLKRIDTFVFIYSHGSEPQT